jgi:transposase, IS5 family
LALDGLREQIETMVPRVKQVMRQTRARIFRGETRSEGKIFSIFEPSTEIIRKGKAGKPNEFGKVVKIQESENQIVVDYEVYDQRSSDSDVLIPAIQADQNALGRTPHLFLPMVRPLCIEARLGLLRATLVQFCIRRADRLIRRFNNG